MASSADGQKPRLSRDIRASQTHSVAFSPDSATLATASYDNTVRLWRTRK